MLVIAWAQMGYLLIHLDDDGRVLLHRRMTMGNERSDFESQCFRRLFGKRKLVDTGSPYYTDIAAMVSGSAAAAFIVFVVVCALAGLLVWYMIRSRFLAVAVALAGLAVLGVLYLVSSAAVTAALSTVLGALALFEPFTGFLNGIFSVSAVVYYLSVIVLFLFLTVQSLERRRYN